MRHIAKYEKWISESGVSCLSAWARRGLTKEEIAQNMGISRSTLHEWERKYPHISDALTCGRDEADCAVENALFKKTQGYNVMVQKTFKIKRVIFDTDTGRKLEEREELQTGYDEVHVPADEKAQEFWLYNRKPSEWKRNREDKAEQTSGGGVIMMPEVKKRE